jgi:hypothetical protein
MIGFCGSIEIEAGQSFPTKSAERHLTETPHPVLSDHAIRFEIRDHRGLRHPPDRRRASLWLRLITPTAARAQ